MTSYVRTSAYDLYDEFDCRYSEPRIDALPDTPDWESRQVMMTYRQAPGTDFAVWYGYLPDGVGVIGASIIGTETSTATWADGTTSAVERRTALDVGTETDTSLSGGDMFRRYYIERHPEQTWKRVDELAVGDRIMELTESKLGLDPDGLPAVIDTIDTPYDAPDRRSVHYTATRTCNGRANPQGASHRFLRDQWARLEHKEPTT